MQAQTNIRGHPRRKPKTAVDIDEVIEAWHDLPYASALHAALKAADEFHRTKKNWAGAKTIRNLTAIGIVQEMLLTKEVSEERLMRDLLWGIGQLADYSLSDHSWSHQNRAQLRAILAIVNCPVPDPASATSNAASTPVTC